LSPSHTLVCSTFKTSLQTAKPFTASLKSEHLTFLRSTQNCLKVIQATLGEQNFVLCSCSNPLSTLFLRGKRDVQENKVKGEHGLFGH